MVHGIEEKEMSILITCPICGPRSIEEFRFGAEDRSPRPFDEKASPETLYAHIHLRTNAAALQKEWWFHREGCGSWFTIWRDTKNNLQVPSPEEMT